MLGTKLLLLSFVVYASGQGVSYNGGSNVRTQGRLPPRSLPLGPYRPAYSPNAEPIRPVYNPQPINQPQPEQPATESQTFYQPPRPNLAESQPDQPEYQLRPVYQPMQPVQPAVPRPLPPVRRPPSLGLPVYNPEPFRPAPVAAETSPQQIPIPSQSELPAQSAPQPINSYPRPLPPWSWKPALPTEAAEEAITPDVTGTNTQLVYPESSPAPPSYNPKAVDAESPMEFTPELGPVEEPTIVLHPEAEEDPSSLTTEDSLPDIEVTQRPVPGLSTPEPLPELMPPANSLRPIPEEPFTDPISDQNQLIPIDISQPPPNDKPEAYPYIIPGSYPSPRPLPTQSRPVPGPGPNIIAPEPHLITSDPVIPSEPSENYQPTEPLALAQADSAPVYLPSRPIQPMQPPRPIQPMQPPRPIQPIQPPNPSQPTQPPRPIYQPIPLAPAPRPLPSPQPDYQPLQPKAPANPIPVNPGIPRPLPPQPPTASPTYEPLKPPTPYPTLVPNPIPEPSQSTPQPSYYPIAPSTPNRPVSTPEISLVTPMNDFQCRKGNGYYNIINECDAYIECQNQRAFKHTCPDGLHFNPQAFYPEYPCSYPSEVQCESTASKQIARPTNECPNRYGFFSISGGDCSKYIMCQEGQATLMNCPLGLVFNDQLSSCDWPENVPQCNPNAFKDFTCPMPPEDDPDLLTRYRYGSDCGMYVACQRGHPRLLRCDLGLSFDQDSQVCIDSDFIAECRIPS